MSSQIIIIQNFHDRENVISIFFDVFGAPFLQNEDSNKPALYYMWYAFPRNVKDKELQCPAVLVVLATKQGECII